MLHEHHDNYTPLSHHCSFHCLTSVDDEKPRAHVTPLVEATFATPSAGASQSLAVFRGACTERRCVLHLEGSLRMPLNGALQHNIGALLRRGRRIIVLDLSAVTRIDAAGIGELVRAYNTTTAAGGVLQISQATGWVREILRRVGLLDILRQG